MGVWIVAALLGMVGAARGVPLLLARLVFRRPISLAF